jgi:serine/threonine-protein kinase
VLVAAVTLWIYGGVRSALAQLAAQNLRTLVTSEVVAVEAWVGERRLNVQRWVADPRVAGAVDRLLAEAGRGEAALLAACKGEAAGALFAAIDSLRQRDVATAVHLIDRDGRVVVDRDGDACGRRLDAGRFAALAPVFEGEVRFAATSSARERIGYGSAEPNVWIAAPVHNGRGQAIAVLEIGKPARERFSQLFEAARVGASGEAYAFDARGRLLTESRFRAQLQDGGVLAPGASAILALRLTVPDAEGGERLTALISEALAASAAGRFAGERLEPYANYLGERVVGAWHWLDEHGFGIAVEVSEDEAFAPLARLEFVFAVLGTLVGVASFALVVSLLRMQRMAREVEAAARVGNYELFEEIGQGGIARVYRAQHRLLKRPTAVKVIQLAQSTDELLERFDREVRLASQLMHPNTIEIFDYGRTPEGLPFYAMELLDGATVQQLVERHGPFPAARAVHVLRGVAGSLAEAHERGLVHRDVTPANVMLCRKGGLVDVPKLLDFGLIKDTRGEHTRDLTRAVKILGTPTYMAPERIERPASADFRSDLYALGAVGYFLLTGKAPLEATTDLSLAYHVVNTEPAEVAGCAPEAVPAPLAELIMQCLAKQAGDRPQTAAGVGEALDRIAIAHPWPQSAARVWWAEHGATATASAAGGAAQSPAAAPRSARVA